MTGPLSNEIVRALTDAVEAALQPPAEERGAPAARDVAQVLGLDGLDRALTVLRAGDPGTESLARRLIALCEASRAQGSLEPFIAADAELGRMAVECGAVVMGDPAAPEGTLTGTEALQDIPLADDASRAVAARVHLTPQVSAALRAAIDWLCENESDRRVKLRTEDSALEVVCRRVDPAGLVAAAKVLGAIGANLGPATADRAHGPWTVRAPIATTRETYLMLSQGGLSLAVPWHSVLKIAMLPRAAFESRVRHLPHPVIEPFEPLSVVVPEYPVVLVGHGLKRAYLLADRLVWRLPAEECPATPDPHVVGHDRCVRTEDGSVYRVLDSGRLLEHVEPPAFELGERSHPGRAARAEAATAPMAAERAAAVQYIPDATADVDASPAEHAAALPIDPARVTPMPLRALVAEDSLSARLALAAMIETHGIEAHAVRDAAELFDALEGGPWALVCVDTDLPDARGPELLRRVAERLRELDAESELVALVRDGEEGAAIAGGIARTLRKPWSRAALERLLIELGIGEGVE